MNEASPYQHLLLTTDLSKASLAVADKAQALATALNVKLSMIHVIDSNPRLYGMGEFALPIDLALEKKILKQAEATLEKERHRLNIPPEQCWLIFGAKIHEILEISQQQQVDLILVGAHDKHGIELLLNSTADKLLHALPCDVVAIKVGESNE